MGISGLLPLLKKATKKTNIRHFSGSVVAIDGFSWLHKGAYGCAQKLGMGEPTTAYVTYFMKYVNILLANGVRPICVFDGRSLPSKEETDRKRRERREENRIKAKDALRDGNKREAWEYFQKSVQITQAMVREVIRELRLQRLDYIIAPYEADAQMAFLANTKIVDMVITEDSDLVLFGCPKIFFKLNVEGDGMIYDQSHLHLCLSQPPEKFQFDRFRQLCIFSGCDYLESLAGIGLARARKVFSMTIHDNVEQILKEAPSIVKLDLNVTEEYISEFQRAENTFLYQLVFDPVTRQLRPLTSYPVNIDETQLPYCGNYESPKLALDMAIGNVDLQTLKPVDNFNMDDPKWGYNTSKSIWSKKYQNIARSLTKASTATIVPYVKGTEKCQRSKKTVVVSSTSILKRQSTRAAEVQKNAGVPEEADSYSNLLLNSMCRSPSPKRRCVRNFYSIGKTNGNNNCDTTKSNVTPPGTSTDSNGSDSVLKRINNDTNDRSLTLNGLNNDDTKEVNEKSGKVNGVKMPESNGQEPLVVLEKLDLGRPKRKCTSRYFTVGRKEFMGNKNHHLFVPAGARGSRTTL